MNYGGKQLGNYRLMSLIGRGAFAEVYLGYHVHLEATVAVKVLHAMLTPGLDRQHFLAEARLIARLEHSHIIRVRDFAVEEEIPFLVMDYAPGGSLRRVCPPGQCLELARILLIVQAIASALSFAHAQGIVHRDIKPENMLLRPQQGIVLSDFGLAVAKGVQQEGFWGTAAYAAPEQFQGKAGPACDQYALAVCVYEWLAGRLPFRGEDRNLLMAQHAHALPPSLCQLVPDLAPAVEHVILRALAKQPEERFETVTAFARALTVAGTEEKARPRIILPRRSVRRVSTPALENDHFLQNAPVLFPAPGAMQIWNVPYHRNPFFTGREALLARIHELLCHPGPLKQPLALCGLGGVGKTQLVVEYAYRYAAAYPAVYFMHGETQETLLNDFLALARLLQIPEEQDIFQVVQAVKDRLTQTAPIWLLILDNVEEMREVLPFVPEAGREHVVITTRAQLTGAATYVEVEELFEEEAALLLLRRARIIGWDEDYPTAPPGLWKLAREIARLVDGLPLALDQAGAYIEETGCSLSQYRERYQTERTSLLKRRGTGTRMHPESVTVTFRLSLTKIEQAHPAAADLLRLCAFFEPVIPEDLVCDTGQHLSPALALAVANPLQLADLYHELRRYSLVRFDPERRLLQVHRLVQAVVQEAMDLPAQRLWAERAIRCVNQAFPNSEEVAAWPRAARLGSHVDHCVALVDEWGCVLPEAACLFNEAGLYFQDHAQYRKAEELLRRAVEIRTILYGPEHPDTAESVNDLGTVLLAQKRAADAESYFRRALALKRQAQGPNHPDVAIACNNLALACRDQGKFAEAETFFRQALAIWQQESAQFGLKAKEKKQHTANIARTLNNLGLLYTSQRRQEDAEAFFLQALAMWELTAGEMLHPDVGRTLNNLGKLYRDQERFNEAERLFLRARVVREQVFGPDHPDVAQTLGDLAHLYARTGRNEEAEELFALALDILEQMLGSDHPTTSEMRRHYEEIHR